ERIGERGEPWGVPFWTSLRSNTIPSTHTAAFLSSKKDFTNLTIGRGILFLRSSARSLSWLTKSKNPLMSKVSAVVTKPLFHAA
ncbi:hypothetical protein EV361DRAFT_813138, partial [Lentinula raphanica]